MASGDRRRSVAHFAAFAAASSRMIPVESVIQSNDQDEEQEQEQGAPISNTVGSRSLISRESEPLTPNASSVEVEVGASSSTVLADAAATAAGRNRGKGQGGEPNPASNASSTGRVTSSSSKES